MIRIAAVDDEAHVLERFERMVADIEGVKLCGLFETGEQLLDFIKDNSVDAVFLDIEMPGENGLILSEKLQNIDENIDIIFSTAFNEYAVEAFELQALDYLMKPLTEERLLKTVDRLRKRKNESKKETLYIQCIGDFELFVNQVAISWKNSKAKEILAFLVHKKGVPVSWEKIATAVWPEYNTEKAQTNFHATTYLLRKKLAEQGISHIFENGRGNYKINIEQFECDVYQLEEKAKSGRIKRKEDILLFEKLSHHGYMEGCGYEWAHPKSAELVKMCDIVLIHYNEEV